MSSCVIFLMVIAGQAMTGPCGAIGSPPVASPSRKRFFLVIACLVSSRSGRVPWARPNFSHQDNEEGRSNMLRPVALFGCFREDDLAQIRVRFIGTEGRSDPVRPFWCQC